MDGQLTLGLGFECLAKAVYACPCRHGPPAVALGPGRTLIRPACACFGAQEFNITAVGKDDKLDMALKGSYVAAKYTVVASLAQSGKVCWNLCWQPARPGWSD